MDTENELINIKTMLILIIGLILFFCGAILAAHHEMALDYLGGITVYVGIAVLFFGVPFYYFISKRNLKKIKK